MHPEDIARHPLNRPSSEDIELVAASSLFDADWYCKTYPDVIASGLDPCTHFLWFAAMLLRDPSPRFQTAIYLEAHPHVAASGINPLVHFLRFTQNAKPVPTLGPQPWVNGQASGPVLLQLRRDADPAGPKLRQITDDILNTGARPKVSVLFRLGNDPDEARRALDSILSQCLQPHEVYIIGDQQVAEALRSHGIFISSVKVDIRACDPVETASACNLALSQASGALVAYLNSDHIWEPDYLQIMCAQFVSSDSTVTAYAHSQGTSHCRPTRTEFLQDTEVNLNTYMHRRRVSDQLGGFDPVLGALMDRGHVLRHTKLYAPVELGFLAASRQAPAPAAPSFSDQTALRKQIRAERFRHGLEAPQIAYVLWDWPALSQSFVLAELRWLVENGHDVEVFFVIAPDRAAHVDFPIVAHQVEGPEELARLLVARARTLVHSHFAFPATTLLAWPACQIAGIPFTFTAYAVDIFLKTNIPRNRIDEVMRDPLCLRAFTHGPYHRTFLSAQNVPEHKLAFTFQAVELDVFRNIPDRPHRLPDAPIRGAFIGRFIEKKGLSSLLDAAALLKDTPVLFDIYGYGQLEGELRQKARDLNLTNVVFHGPLEGREAVKNVLTKSDFCIVPSVVASTGDTEGFPTIILQAMAAHLPVISTHVSAIPDYLSDGVNALLAPPNDPEALGNAVRRLLAMDPPQQEALLREADALLDKHVGLKHTMQTYFDTWCDTTVDIVLATYNTAEHDNTAATLDIIDRIRRHTTTPYTLTVVDNGSDDTFRSQMLALTKELPQMRYLPLSENLYVGGAINLALAASDSTYCICICSKEGFVLRHGWERALISHMRAHPDTAMAGHFCHLPAHTLGTEITHHPAFANFRNPQFAADHPDRPFRHLQGGVFILRRDSVGPDTGFSELVPQAGTDVEFSYYLESKGDILDSLPDVTSLTAHTRPGLDAVIDEHTVIAHPLNPARATEYERMQNHDCTRCNLCNGWNCLSPAGLCSGCDSTGLDRKLYQALAHDWRAHRGQTALLVNCGARLAHALGDGMFDVTTAYDADPASMQRYSLVCLGQSPDTAMLQSLIGQLAPHGLLIWPEDPGTDLQDISAHHPDIRIVVSHRVSRVLRNDWRRLHMMERVTPAGDLRTLD